MSAAYPIRDLVDIRTQLYRNGSGGPRRQVPLAGKRGAVLHYSGDAQDLSRSDLQILVGESAYHAFQRDWGSGQRGDGLMYHISIGRHGEKWLCRDLEAVLWHCGTSLNSTAIAIHLPLGGTQRATPAALRALGEVCADLEAMRLLDRQSLWGHRELGTTATCPGTLMQDFVLPYRAGTLGIQARTWQELVTAYAAEHGERLALGRQLASIELRQPDWTGEMVVYGYRYDRGVLVAVRGQVWDLTGRLLDEGAERLRAAGMYGERADL